MEMNVLYACIAIAHQYMLSKIEHYMYNIAYTSQPVISIIY